MTTTTTTPAAMPSLAQRPTWTPEQTQTVHAIRGATHGMASPIGAPSTLDALQQLPEDVQVPDGLTITPAVAQPAADSMLPELLETSIKPQPVVYWTYRHKEFNTTVDPSQTKVVLYCHGGGNTTNSPVSATYVPRFHQLLSHAPRSSSSGSDDNQKQPLGANTVIVAPAYRLAICGEHAFPAVQQDLWFVYQDLVGKLGYKPHNISLVGDSSGGNLALCLAKALSLRSTNLTPAKLVAFAPAADLTHAQSQAAKQAHDVDLFSMDAYEAMTANYLWEPNSKLAEVQPPPTSYKRFSRDHPLVSAAHVGHNWPAKFPRTLVFVGDADQLADASHKVVADLKASGAADVSLTVLQDMPHGWWILDCFPQCAQTWAETGDFLAA